MSAERPVFAGDVSGSHRLELVPEPGEARELRELREARELLRERPRALEPSGRTPPAPSLGDIIPTDLGAPELYLNRELTYLNFCWRVLHEAEDDRLPLLERVKFIAIVSSNIDEFFQKRVGGLKQQVGAQLHSVTQDGRTPQQQIADSVDLITRLEAYKARTLERVKDELKAAGVWIAPFKDLDPQQRAWVREYYVRNIFPL